MSELSQSGYVPYETMIDVARKEDHRRIKRGAGKVRSNKTERWTPPPKSDYRDFAEISFEQYEFDEQSHRYQVVSTEVIDDLGISNFQSRTLNKKGNWKLVDELLLLADETDSLLQDDELPEILYLVHVVDQTERIRDPLPAVSKLEFEADGDELEPQEGVEVQIVSTRKGKSVREVGAKGSRSQLKMSPKDCSRLKDLSPEIENFRGIIRQYIVTSPADTNNTKLQYRKYDAGGCHCAGCMGWLEGESRKAKKENLAKWSDVDQL
eukprot:TRINITY_DN13284_c0_g1_i1.p1 TRINITY_DN13284_c0_g1~~TRINITY_DN13284_c0_g1_i1.p1  ORF type:complete len:266 (+),score=62.56 TRINITY_DN13284_c0_g1_i1:170-967(+)